MAWYTSYGLFHQSDDDSVGVVTVEGLNANDTLTGWIMDQDVLIDIKINQDIPIGHKIAIKDLNKDDTVIKYGVDIGRTISQIKVGKHQSGIVDQRAAGGVHHDGAVR